MTYIGKVAKNSHKKMGCCWCLEAIFNEVHGVHSVTSGYSNGHDPAPNYERVCDGLTGHAEVVRIGFDPSVIDYETLLTLFFVSHDPTTLNRQGHDEGTQYRSGIYTHDEAQMQIARQVIAQLSAMAVWPSPIVTEVQAVTNFHPAEDYHTRYAERHPHQGYCVHVVAPKVAHVRQTLGHLMRKPSTR